MPDQGAAWILRDSPSAKRQTWEFNLEATNVINNIFYGFRRALDIFNVIFPIPARTHH